MTLVEHLRTVLWEVSEQLYLGDVGMKYLKYDGRHGASPKVVGYDFDSRGWWA